MKKCIRIGIIGAGSIGSLFGGSIAGITSDAYKLEVFFFCDKEHAKAITASGLKICKNQDVRVVSTIIAYENEEIIEERIEEDPSFRFDFIFLTTKAYDIETAVVQYKKIINVSDNLVILQNGIGNEDIVGNYIPRSKIIRAVTTNGALLQEPGRVLHTGDGIVKIGIPFQEEFRNDSVTRGKTDSDLKLLGELIRSAGFEIFIVEDIIKESWEKVFVNIGINAFGALTGLKNGQLLESEGLKQMMGEAITEAITVAKMKHIELTEGDFIALTYDVASKTAENKNSMLQDILNGQPTEIDFINGRVLKYAKELNIKAPINELLTYLIKGLEFSSR
ncbi:MAG: ketopantoate reductase family protein [Promethearchaeota archaeon]|jgi:2-dehydropantoate 2-reductase